MTTARPPIPGPRPEPDAVLDRIARARLIVIVRSPTQSDALRVGRILIEAGVDVLEVTCTTPHAHDVVTSLRQDADPGVLLGMGSVRTVTDVRRADDAGADFLVSPGSPATLCQAMLATGRLALAGVFTATEVIQASELGIQAVKLFPASLIGPGGLRALLAPFPDVAFVPTGGIGAHEVRDWLDAGALAVGLGGSLAPPTLAGPEQTRELSARVRVVLEELAGTAPR